MIRIFSLCCWGVLAWAVEKTPVNAALVEQHLIILRNASIEVGIFLAGAGRAVILRRPGGANRLNSDPRQWVPDAVPAPEKFQAFADIGGHMIWLAPQAEWWRQQHVTTQHYGMWPPDPWLIHAPYHVIYQSVDELTLRGPPSAISGVIMEKRYRLKPNAVELTTTATNCRTTPVSWALWSNLHPLAEAIPYVPLAAGESLSVIHDGKDPATAGLLAYQVIEGLFTIPQTQIAAHAGVRTLEAKFLLASSSAWMFAVGSDWAIAVRTAGIHPSQAAPRETPIELYQIRHLDGSGASLLELEHQGAYRTVLPGELLTLTEQWHLIDHTAGDAPVAQAAMVNTWLARQPR